MKNTNTLDKITAAINNHNNELLNDIDKLELNDDVLEILSCIIDNHNHRLEENELVEYYQLIEEKIEDDFYVDIDGNEYRIIADSAIWDIYVDEIKNIVEDCYDLKLEDIPAFVSWEIDWEQTAKNAYDDGYGHTFSSYDFSEYETNNYYIFRVN